MKRSLMVLLLLGVAATAFADQAYDLASLNKQLAAEQKAARPWNIGFWGSLGIMLTGALVAGTDPAYDTWTSGGPMSIRTGIGNGMIVAGGAGMLTAWFTNSHREPVRELKAKIKTAELTSNYGDVAATAIAQHRIYIGMPREAVIASWGYPQRINTTVTASGKEEQFVYGSLPNARYVYIENGVVTAIQT